MKYFRLILIGLMVFGVVIVACVFLFYMSDGSLFSKKKDYVYYQQTFTDEWNKVDDWSETLFLQHVEILKDLPQDPNTEKLRDFNTRKAIEIIFDKLMLEWENPECDRNVIAKYISALEKILAIDIKANIDIDLILALEINKIYQSACELVSKPVSLAPQFNGSSWNSFSAYADLLKSKTVAISEDVNYQKYLSNIEEIKNYMESLPGNLRKAKNVFSSELSNKICAYFQKTARTSVNLSRLHRLQAAYNAEFGYNEGLNSFIKAFAQDVKKNSK